MGHVLKIEEKMCEARKCMKFEKAIEILATSRMYWCAIDLGSVFLTLQVNMPGTKKRREITRARLCVKNIH